MVPFASQVGHGWSIASTPNGTPADEPTPPHVLQDIRPDPLHVAQTVAMPSILYATRYSRITTGVTS